MTAPLSPALFHADRLTRRYVRVTARDAQWVAFEFSLGDPALYVELVMRPEQFDAFCAAQGAIAVPCRLGEALERERGKWSETVA
jgi:phenol hydroxylase P0 protein